MQNLKQTDIFVLSGGIGSRLRSEVGEAQKTMASVGGRPFLDIIMDYLSSQGFRRVILCTGYKSGSVEQYYENSKFPLDIEFSRETKKLGTGGAVKNAEPLVKSDIFFVMNGDSFCAIDYCKMLDFHLSHQARASIAISKVHDAQDYGSILLEKSSEKIKFFGEKISSDAKYLRGKESFVNNGIYCFNRDIFSIMPQQDFFSLEKDFFPNITDKSFFGFKVNEEFLDIGTPQRYGQAKDKFSYSPSKDIFEERQDI